jgi:cytochrome c553
MKKIIFTLFIAISSINAVYALEGDAVAGKTKSATCAACHGATGISAIPNYPNLAGQNGAYITKQLNDFKAGNRVDPLMSAMAANLSEQDIADLTAYFSGLPRDGKVVVANDPGESTVAAPAGKVDIVASTPASAIYKGNVSAGKSKSATCSACHGADGNSLIPMYPNLAGQSANYLAKQLKEFKSGDRNNPVMAGMVAALNEEDMYDLAAFFAVQEAKPGTGEGSDIGKKLYFSGDAAKGVTACIACHGVNGKGMKQAGFPNLAGQSNDYLKTQLTMFRDGTRNNDSNGMMRNIAIKLSDDDIEELAKYMSSLK